MSNNNTVIFLTVINKKYLYNVQYNKLFLVTTYTNKKLFIFIQSFWFQIKKYCILNLYFYAFFIFQLLCSYIKELKNIFAIK